MKSKATLKHIIGVEIKPRHWGVPTVIVIDFSAFLWTVKWPTSGTLQGLYDEIKRRLRQMLTKSDVHLIQDRYRDYSRKCSTRAAREESSGINCRKYTLRPSMPILKKDQVLKCYHNKIQLNRGAYEDIMNDEKFLTEATRTHRFLMMNENTVPYMVVKGRKIPRMDLGSTHEEADNIVAKHAIIRGEEADARIKVLADDTDIFALLTYFYKKQNLTCPMVMQSPRSEGTTQDIKATVNHKPELSEKVLAIHVSSGMDTVAPAHTIAKIKAVNNSTKVAFSKLGYPNSSI